MPQESRRQIPQIVDRWSESATKINSKRAQRKDNLKRNTQTRKQPKINNEPIENNIKLQELAAEET